MNQMHVDVICLQSIRYFCLFWNYLAEDNTMPTKPCISKQSPTQEKQEAITAFEVMNEEKILTISHC